MNKSISIIDKEYQQWVDILVERYQCCQVRAAIHVNSEQLLYNWLLGRDIVEMHVEQRWGEKVVEQLSKDLKEKMPTVEGLSVTNLRYCRRFYLLYSQKDIMRPQVEGEFDRLPDKIQPQVGGELVDVKNQAIFSVPWGHHKLILDKVKGDVEKALYYINQVLENNWSRSMLLNWIDTGLYERSGKAITNFRELMPNVSGDLAQELTKDPYNFAFAGVTKKAQ